MFCVVMVMLEDVTLRQVWRKFGKVRGVGKGTHAELLLLSRLKHE